MDRRRFEDLAGAYGGDIARWPETARDDAALLAAGDPEFAAAVLAREGGLDAILHEAPRIAASSTLFEAVMRTAPPLRRRAPWRRWIAPAGLGAGLAAVTAAGMVIGAQVGWSPILDKQSVASSVADLDVSSISEVG